MFPVLLTWIPVREIGDRETIFKSGAHWPATSAHLIFRNHFHADTHVCACVGECVRESTTEAINN